MIPVTTSDIYDGVSGGLHPNGLFSNVIFGNHGEKRRMTTFSYIDLRVKILHPAIVRNIKKVNAFYYDILMGKAHGEFDARLGEFVKATGTTGETGYHFFMSKWDKIKWKKNDSDRRTKRIDVINKYRHLGVYDFFLVTPAAIRDIEELPDGTVTQDDVNDLYRSLIGTARSVDVTDLESKYNNQARCTMQRTIEKIYDLYYSYLKGKRGLIQGKWSKRRIEHGTRGVLSALDYSTPDINSDQTITPNHAVMGLYQTLKAYLPYTVHALTNGIMQQIFTENDQAYLIDKKTLKRTRVDITPKTRSRWTSFDGINTLINQFAIKKKRNEEVVIEGKYLALIWRSKRGFRIVLDIDDLDGRDSSKCKPITWGELYYFLCYPIIKGFPQHVTRYPVNNVNSCVPMISYLVTTTKGESLFRYNENWELTDEEFPQCPIVGGDYTDVTPVHPTKYSAGTGLGADNDGDQVGNNSLLTDNGIKEVHDLLNDVDFYFNTDGDLEQNFNTYPFKLFLLSTTGLVRFDEDGNSVK